MSRSPKRHLGGRAGVRQGVQEKRNHQGHRRSRFPSMQDAQKAKDPVNAAHRHYTPKRLLKPTYGLGPRGPRLAGQI
jgi:hypothetical protein